MEDKERSKPEEVDVEDIMDFINDDRIYYKIIAASAVIVSSIVLIVFSIIFFKDYIF